jgi:acyl dehydratase/CBS domain-containing protein
MLVTLTVEDVMSSPVETVAPDATAAAAARALRDARIGSLVVTDGDGPVGILTEADVVDLVAREADAGSLTVAEILSDDLVTVEPDVTIEDAAVLLAEHDIRRLPVCEDGDLVGIVTTTDLSYYLPHLSRKSEGWTDRLERLHSTSPSTTYDDPDWSFEHEGDGPVSVGDVVRFRKELSDDDVRQFAEVTGDTNRLHLEEDFAAGTRFGSRIAHGMLTAGVISAALARLPGLTVYLSQDLRFLGPVAVGETVTAECEVVEDLGRDKYELTTTVYDGDGEVVVDGEAVVMMAPFPEGSERPGDVLEGAPADGDATTDGGPAQLQ